MKWSSTIDFLVTLSPIFLVLLSMLDSRIKILYRRASGLLTFGTSRLGEKNLYGSENQVNA